MPDAFVIMQIGSPELDAVYAEVLEPAIKACGLAPRRVDKHNRGDLLHSEIMRFIRESKLVIADLTNERPNCYLEVGLSLGFKSTASLILTARADHNPSSSEHDPNGPKVHFDLASYDIIYWDPGDKETFRARLETLIRRRIGLLAATRAAEPHAQISWLESLREEATTHLGSIGRQLFWEFAFVPHQDHDRFLPADLLEAARLARLPGCDHPSPLPDNVVGAPTPLRDGIGVNPGEAQVNWLPFWRLSAGGAVYICRPFTEHDGKGKELFFDNQIRALVLNLLIGIRLCRVWRFSESSLATAVLRLHGLRGMSLGAQDLQILRPHRPSDQDLWQASVGPQLGQLLELMPSQVRELLDPCFQLFDFMTFPLETYSEIVRKTVSQTDAKLAARIKPHNELDG